MIRLCADRDGGASDGDWALVVPVMVTELPELKVFCPDIGQSADKLKVPVCAVLKAQL